MSARDLDRQIVAIALPALAALLSEPVMLAVDTAVVGHLGRAELAALGAAGAVLTTILGLCIFLAYGSTAAVARHRGAGQDREAMGLALSGMWLAAGLGLCLGAVTWASAPGAAGLFSPTTPVAVLTETYLRIGALSVPAVLLVLATTGALRGVLDLRTPLVVMVGANGLNLVLTVWFVLGLDLGLTGAAWGLVLAQWAAAVVLVTTLVRRARAHGASTAPQWAEILDSARTGLGLLVRTMSLRAVFLVATWVAATMGDTSLAAHQIVTTVVFFLAFVLDALAIAAQTLVGGALGAGDRALTRRVSARAARLGVLFGVVTAAALVVSAPWLPQVFSADADVRHTAIGPLVVVGLAMPLAALVYVWDGVLIGAGDSVYLAVAGLLTLAVHAPVAWWVSTSGADLTWLWGAWVVFMVARGVTLWLRQRHDAWLVLGAP